MKRIVLVSIFFVCLWLCTAAPLSLNVSRGFLKLVLHSDTGSFSLYYLTDKKKQKYTPLLSSDNNSATTVFSLQIDETIYELKPSSRVTVRLEEIPDGARLHYIVKKRAEVSVDFIFLSSEENHPEDALKVEIGIKNLEDISHTYSVKGVFDTLLGEVPKKHFSTLIKPVINIETVFTDMEADKWLMSANERISVLFLFFGSNITVPRQITLSARDVLLDNPWLPRSSLGRSFNTPGVLNNSALQVVWQPLRLSPGTTGFMRFYITAAADGLEPAYVLKDAESFVATQKAGFYTDSTGASVSIAELTENQLDPEYIGELIRRIENLEKNPTGVSPDEIKRLNAELDAILDRLKGR